MEPNETPESDMLTTKEMAAMKGVTVAAITDGIRRGKIAAVPVIQPGHVRGTWRIPRAEAERWQPVKDPHERAMLGGRPRIHQKRAARPYQKPGRNGEQQ